MLNFLAVFFISLVLIFVWYTIIHTFINSYFDNEDVLYVILITIFTVLWIIYLINN